MDRVGRYSALQAPRVCEKRVRCTFTVWTFVKCVASLFFPINKPTSTSRPLRAKSAGTTYAPRTRPFRLGNAASSRNRVVHARSVACKSVWATTDSLRGCGSNQQPEPGLVTASKRLRPISTHIPIDLQHPARTQTKRYTFRTSIAAHEKHPTRVGRTRRNRKPRVELRSYLVLLLATLRGSRWQKKLTPEEFEDTSVMQEQQSLL